MEAHCGMVLSHCSLVEFLLDFLGLTINTNKRISRTAMTSYFLDTEAQT